MADNVKIPSKLADFLPYQLSVTSNAVSSVIASRYRTRFGLKVPEWRVMAVLGNQEGATQRELTEATLMDKVAVNRAWKVMEERGLIQGQPNARDGRSHLLELTEEGRAVYGDVMPLALKSESEVFAGLDPHEQDQLRGLLKKVFDKANSIRPASQ